MTVRRVSVVVPTCDRTAQLRRALESIRAIEGPDLRFEILVSDNGAAPETSVIVAEFGGVYLKVAEKGPSAARNAAMYAATGDYLAFLDDDDAWTPDHIRPHLELFEADPDLNMVIGQVVSTDEEYRPIGEPWLKNPPAPGPDLLRRMLSGYFPQIGGIVVRTRMRDEAGRFDTSLPGGEDLDWLIRIAKTGQVAFANTPCVLYTLRQGGTFDELQIQRVKFDRLVFHRYALRWLYLWRSPMEYCRAYSGTLMHFYKYFVDAALERTRQGERAAALSAIWNAVRIFPLRAVKHMFSDTKLRAAVLWVLAPQKAMVQLHHIPVWICFLYI